ncbi:MAG: Eco57I restriction-modification methylase domain-containing protein [Pedobacter sp.]
MTITELKQLLQRPYNRTDWQGILREVFPQVSIFAHPTSIVCDHQDVESFQQLGNVHLNDDKNLAIFEIALSHRVKIPRNRVELRNLVAKHIDQEINHGVLVIFIGQNDDYRFTFTAKESEFSDDGEFVERQTATKRFTYLLGPHETCTTAARRLLQLGEKKARTTLADVVDAFSVEKLNKEFFNLYKEHYATFVNHLLSGDAPQEVFGIPRLSDEKEQDKANKPVRDFAKRLLGRLVFLYFLQKKGWLGCPATPVDWINGDRDFVRNLFLTSPNREKFYSTRLVPLFFEALNQPDRPQAIFPITGTRVPYLNGGLFEHEKLPNDHKPLPVEKLDFPATLFEKLLEFFGQYNFTIDENDPDDHEVGIDPEMLGHIFENLLEDNKDKGAFYTPKAIVQYMCQQSLINYLQQHLGEHQEIVNLVRFKDAGSATDKTNWVRQNAKHIEELLDSLKICDPAIGSGAFPIGLLQEIYWIKLTLDWTLDPAETKLKIIQNSIYGVDIDAGAVEIARLRFWLSLIVDEDEPRPLPNLDYKIMQGDSLLESFEGIPLDNLQQVKGFKVEVFSKQGQGQMFPGALLEYSQTKESSAKAKEISALINRYFGETNPLEKQMLHKKIDRFVLDHIDYNLQIQEEKFSDELTLRRAEIARKSGLVKGWKPAKKEEQRLVVLEDGLKSIATKKVKLQELEEKPERPYFLWNLFFQDVFEQGGFDIVIANPPFIRHETIKAQKPQLEREYGDFFCGTADLYTYFFKLGIEKLKTAGHLCFIVPNKFMRAGYGKNSRALLTTAAQPKVVLDFRDLPIFDAKTYPSILLVEKMTIVGANGIRPPFVGITKDSDNGKDGGNPDKGACNAPLQNLQTDIVALETEIDQLVYALYDLTADEIALVEGRR